MYRSVVQPQKKWEQLQCVGWSPGHLVTWSPGHVWWVDECHEGQHLHTESLWCIWHYLTVSKNGHEGHDTMELESSLCLLAEPIFEFSCRVPVSKWFKLAQTPKEHPGRIGGIVCIGWQVLSSWKSRLQIVDIYFMTKNVTISILIWIWYGSPTSIWRLRLHDRRQWAPQRLSASETPMATPIGTTAPGPHGQKHDTAACDVVCKIT